MKATLALIAVLLVLQNRSVSASLNVSEIFSNLFDATFNSTGFLVEVVIVKPLSAFDACAYELNSSVRKEIADAGADFRQALRIQQTDADDFENLSQLQMEFVGNVNNCEAQMESYGCYFSAMQKVVLAVQAQTHSFVPVDNVKIFFRLVELFKSLENEYAKFYVCLMRHPEVTSPPGKESSDSSEAEETTANPSSDSSEAEGITANPSSDSSEAEKTTANPISALPFPHLYFH